MLNGTPIIPAGNTKYHTVVRKLVRKEGLRAQGGTPCSHIMCSCPQGWLCCEPGGITTYYAPVHRASCAMNWVTAGRLTVQQGMKNGLHNWSDISG